MGWKENFAVSRLEKGREEKRGREGAELRRWDCVGVFFSPDFCEFCDQSCAGGGDLEWRRKECERSENCCRLHTCWYCPLLFLRKEKEREKDRKKTGRQEAEQRDSANLKGNLMGGGVMKKHHWEGGWIWRTARMQADVRWWAFVSSSHGSQALAASRWVFPCKVLVALFLGVPKFFQFYIKFYSSLLSLFFLVHPSHLSLLVRFDISFQIHIITSLSFQTF